MTDNELNELKTWIATDTSDYAARIREALRPTVQHLADTAIMFTRWSEQSDHHRRAVMRRKIRRMVR